MFGYITYMNLQNFNLATPFLEITSITNFINKRRKTQW